MSNFFKIALCVVCLMAIFLWSCSIYKANRIQIKQLHIYLLIALIANSFNQIMQIVYKLTCPWNYSKDKQSYEVLLYASKFVTELLMLLLLISFAHGMYICIEKPRNILYASYIVILFGIPSFFFIQNDSENYLNIVFLYKILIKIGNLFNNLWVLPNKRLNNSNKNLYKA